MKKLKPLVATVNNKPLNIQLVNIITRALRRNPQRVYRSCFLDLGLDMIRGAADVIFEWHGAIRVHTNATPIIAENAN